MATARPVQPRVTPFRLKVRGVCWLAEERGRENREERASYLGPRGTTECHRSSDGGSTQADLFLLLLHQCPPPLRLPQTLDQNATSQMWQVINRNVMVIGVLAGWSRRYCTGRGMVREANQAFRLLAHFLPNRLVSRTSGERTRGTRTSPSCVPCILACSQRVSFVSVLGLRSGVLAAQVPEKASAESSTDKAHEENGWVRHERLEVPWYFPPIGQSVDRVSSLLLSAASIQDSHPASDRRSRTVFWAVNCKEQTLSRGGELFDDQLNTTQERCTVSVRRSTGGGQTELTFDCKCSSRLVVMWTDFCVTLGASMVIEN
ncbi:hypothetical protein VTO42DRAFT_2529 [Malbranchea cinnamomea]